MTAVLPDADVLVDVDLDADVPCRGHSVWCTKTPHPADIRVRSACPLCGHTLLRFRCWTYWKQAGLGLLRCQHCDGGGMLRDDVMRIVEVLRP